MSKHRGPLVVACIPSYNEDKTIAKVISLTRRFVDRVIVCDDGSADMTAEISEKLGVDVVKHEKNMGYGVAIQTLFKKAMEFGADIMVTLDSDGQHDPQYIPSLIEPILNNVADVAIGSRFSEGMNADDVPRHRRVGIKVITKLTGAALNYAVTDAQNGFRAYSRKALEKLKLQEEGMGVSVEILFKIREQGLRVVEVPVACNYRGLDTSTQSALAHGMNVFISILKYMVKRRPLIFLGIPGIISLILGATLGTWILKVFSLQGHIVTNVALVLPMTLIMIGLFAIFTAMKLHVAAVETQKPRMQ